MRLAYKTDLIDGWQVTERGDGGFGVYDEHGLIDGPFGTREGAIKAALLLPKRGTTSFSMREDMREPS